MKNFRFILASLLVLTISLSTFAQTTSEKIKVNGECNTCKKKIETAAKQAGATYAVWNKNTKELVFKYDAGATNTAKVEQAIANAGYDTQDVKASDDAYNNLDDCCKYDRSASAAKAVKAEASCMKDGKCIKDMSCCKDEPAKDCCKKG